MNNILLTEMDVLNEKKIADIRNEFKEKIESELAIGFNSKPMVVDTEVEMEDVYAKAPAYGQSGKSQVSRHKSLIIQDSLRLWTTD